MQVQMENRQFPMSITRLVLPAGLLNRKPQKSLAQAVLAPKIFGVWVLLRLPT
jgi:hypothetical protein